MDKSHERENNVPKMVWRQKAGLHSQSPSIHATSNKPHTQTQQIQCNIKNE
jgi:hypothetical protein